jgi:kynurenine formamidase
MGIGRRVYRGGTMKRILIVSLAATLPFVLGERAAAQAWNLPTDAQRCPSKWGPDDTRGSANHVTPTTVLAAMQMVKTGQIIELGRVLEGSMPVFGTRRFDLHTKRTVVNPGRNHRGSNEEIVISEIGQVGTQFDAFPHQMIGGGFYNCVPVAGNESRTGFGKLGVESVGSLVARGVLIDVAALKGVPVLPDTYEITAQDLEQAVARQRLTLKRGDAILIYTGWGTLWNVDNTRYVKTCPGIGIAAAEWLAAHDPLLIGADNWPVEVGPNPDPDLSLPVHQVLLVVHGIHTLENLKLDVLAAERVHEFAFVVQPLKIKGGTGSTVAPIAIR